MQPIVPTGDHNPNDHDETEVLEALRARTGTRRWSFRYELLDSANVKIGDLSNVKAAKVDQNWLADIKRTATFTVAEVDYIDYLSDRIKPWAILHLPPYGPSDWVEWPLGVFVLSTPTRSITDAQHVHREVAGYDLLQVLADETIHPRQVVTAGTLYTTAIWILLGECCATVDWNTTAVPVDIEWEPGTSKLKIINDLLGAINYESLSVDEDGLYQVRRYQPPSERAPEYTYADDHQGLMLPDAEQTVDLFSVPNHWVRVHSSPDRVALSSEYTNSDPGSLTSTVRRGRTITDWATVNDVADQLTLDAMVARIAFEASQVYEVFTFKTGLNPLHSGNDVYRIIYSPLAIDDLYSEHSWSLSLRAGAAMTHRARRLVNLA
jgi:hypothetical protein